MHSCHEGNISQLHDSIEDRRELKTFVSFPFTSLVIYLSAFSLPGLCLFRQGSPPHVTFVCLLGPGKAGANAVPC